MGVLVMGFEIIDLAWVSWSRLAGSFKTRAGIEQQLAEVSAGRGACAIVRFMSRVKSIGGWRDIGLM